MNIIVEHLQGTVPVTVMRLHGDLDGSSYQGVIARARELYGAGTRKLLIDMSQTPYMGSSGLVALHSIALLLRGDQPPDPEAGWEALHAITRDENAGVQQNVKLLSPQPRVGRTLEMTGLKEFFEIHTDLQDAVASFSA